MILPIIGAFLLLQNPAIDRIFEAYDKPDSPGCALGVFQKGHLAYRRGYGAANLDFGIPISSTSVFDIGSVSKQFTAASVILLSQQGKLALDDDIRRHLPEVPDYGHRITIRHLLNHTSGLRDYLTLMNLSGMRFEDIATDDDLLRLISRQRELNFKPGDEYLYSNSGYLLLGIIVKRASGMTLARFAEASIFRPLGMFNTRYYDDRKMIVKNRSIGYAPDTQAGGFRLQHYPALDVVGDGGVYTTAEDMLLWDGNFSDPRVGGPEFLEEMHKTGVLNDGTKLEYASGLTLSTYRGVPTVGHGGSWAGYRAEFLRFPEQQFSVAVLCNLSTSNPGALARRVADHYLAGELKPLSPAAARAVPPPPPEPAVVRQTASLEDLAGEYSSAELEAVYRLNLREGKLFLTRRNAADTELIPQPNGSFRAGSWVLQFDRDGFTIAAGRVKNIRFERIRS